MATTDAKIVAVDDLHPDSLVVRPDGKVGLRVYKDVIYTRGVLTMDDEGRLVLRDAMIALQPPTAINIGQTNLMRASVVSGLASSIGSQYTDTNHERYYLLGFNFHNTPKVLRGMTLWLNYVNGSEKLTPIKWVDFVDGTDMLPPEGTEATEDNGNLKITITDFQKLNSANAYLLFKHSDDTMDYESNYGGFEDDVRRGPGRDSDRWRFEPDVDITVADWPKAYATDLVDLAQRAYTFNVYG